MKPSRWKSLPFWQSGSHREITDFYVVCENGKEKSLFFYWKLKSVKTCNANLVRNQSSDNSTSVLLFEIDFTL